MSGTLAASYHHLVGVYGETLDVIGVASVVPLTLLLHVKQHHYGCHEVHDLAGW